MKSAFSSWDDFLDSTQNRSVNCVPCTNACNDHPYSIKKEMEMYQLSMPSIQELHSESELTLTALVWMFNFTINLFFFV